MPELSLFIQSATRALKLLELSTTDVPLDPEDQPDYRANREIVADHAAFFAMKEDAKLRRSFSNIVAEFTTEFDETHPLKIIGGQHRFEAIKEAYAAGVNEVHGVKVYFGLSSEQRFDAQLISNTLSLSGRVGDQKVATDPLCQGSLRFPRGRGTASARVYPQRVFLALSPQNTAVTAKVAKEFFSFHPTTTRSWLASGGKARRDSSRKFPRHSSRVLP
jgi:hypothetical protein